MLAAAALGALGLAAHDAGACSCAGPGTTLLTPAHAEAAPLNTRVRVRTASGGRGRVVLRAHGSGAEIAVTERRTPYGATLSAVEVTPSAPLAPETRYEVAIWDDQLHPPLRVFGTFRTGAAADTTAPRFDKIGAVRAARAVRYGGGSCQAPGPWVTIDGIDASDPGRADAQLAMGVWVGDASGRVDGASPPVAVERPHQGSLQLGRSSVCDPRDFAFPSAVSLWLGLAAIDEAGNRSPMRKVRVDLPAVPP